MKAYCKACNRELDETEWTMVYQQSYQMDYCMECYGEKTADLVRFTRDFAQTMTEDLIGKIVRPNHEHKHPIRNWINKQFTKYLIRVLETYDFHKHFKSLWALLRGNFDYKIEACMLDYCEDCENNV